MSDVSQRALTRPITMAVLAMGGEGGGVLADWAVDMAEQNGYWAQTTSVPGVAQRTGATVYYLEFFKNEGTGEPILSVMPTPGEVDIVVASELMEASRAVFRGFVTQETTTLIASTNRVYSMQERTAMGDGRVSSAELIDACAKAARRFIADNFAKVAEDSGTVISAALFGALAGSNSLPFEKSEFIKAIERSGVGVKNSLAAFEKAYAISQASLAPVSSSSTAVSVTIGPKPTDTSNGLSPEEELAIIDNPRSVVGPKLVELADSVKEKIPAPARIMVINGVKRCADYQDVAYAERYLARIEQILAVENSSGDGTMRLLNEVARYTALWMTYEDTIRVADLKTRRTRFGRVNKEAKINNDQIMQVREYLHPMAEEIADTLPTFAGRAIMNSAPVQKFINNLTKNGMRLQTTSVHGYLLLYTLARLRFIRPRSLRFTTEQQRIDAWLALINEVAQRDYSFACEIAETATVIKGYGDTHKNGWRNFTAIIDEAKTLHSAKSSDAASRIAQLRQAALADETGSKLRQILQ